MKTLLIGRDGQLGMALQRCWGGPTELVAVGRAQCDVADPAQLRALVIALAPEVIVNAAAYTAVDRAQTEIEMAHAVNAVAPKILAEEAERLGAMLVHFSTDYVFDGEKPGAYVETDAPKPLNVYGASKWAGELAVQNTCKRHLILRTSWLYASGGANFLTTMLRLAAERETLQVVADQWGSPTPATWLAEVTRELLARYARAPDAMPFGLYHAAASGCTNWHEYACFAIEHARAIGMGVRVATGAVSAIESAQFLHQRQDGPTAPRPRRSELGNALLRERFGLSVPQWQSGVAAAVSAGWRVRQQA